MRVTSGTIMRNYSNRLNSVLNSLNEANERVSTQRKYNKGYENPTESAKSKLLRREYQQNDDYKNAVKDAQSRYDAMESSMMNISNILQDAYKDINKVISGTNGPDERSIVANELREMQKSLVKEANTKFADQYMFGGSNTKGEPPFAFDEESGKLTFRGIDVDSTDPAEREQLKKMAGEEIYIDLGFGLSFVDSTNLSDPNNKNEIVSGSAYNIAMPGISFLGYADADGKSHNVITTLGEIADALEDPAFTIDKIKPLSDKFADERQVLLANVTKLGSNTKFLEYTANRFDTNELTLTKKINDTEYIDLAKAISDFKVWDTTYRAALQSGMDILSVSFIDFMK